MGGDAGTVKVSKLKMYFNGIYPLNGHCQSLNVFNFNPMIGLKYMVIRIKTFFCGF